MKNLSMGLLAGLTLLAASCEKKPGSSGGGGVGSTAPAAKSSSHILARKDELGAVGKARIANIEKVMSNAALKFEGGGQRMEGTFSRREFRTEITEVLDKTKARLTLARIESEGSMVLNGTSQPTPENPDPLREVPVILELKDGTWTATFETGAPTPAQQQALEKVAAEFGGEGYTLYGDTPRKPGDRWEVDASKLGEFGGLESLAGTFRVEFIEVKEFKGTPCAVLEMKIDISGLATRERSIKPMSMKLKGNAVVHRSLEDLVDLEQLLEGEATIEGEPAPGMSMWTKGPMKVTSQASVQPR